MDGNVLVEIAFEAATPFGVGSGEGESGEEFGEGTRRRRPVDLAEGVDQILRRYVAPIHDSRRFQKVLLEPSRGCTDGLGGKKNKNKNKNKNKKERKEEKHEWDFDWRKRCFRIFWCCVCMQIFEKWNLGIVKEMMRGFFTERRERTKKTKKIK